ncbi:hypothetical protein J6590_038787 [Homalodisca vitripennis]|nr:hypothetical protein J6590_038787 [Homalodisca vitripennis]
MNLRLNSVPIVCADAIAGPGALLILLTSTADHSANYPQWQSCSVDNVKAYSAEIYCTVKASQLQISLMGVNT